MADITIDAAPDQKVSGAASFLFFFRLRGTDLPAKERHPDGRGPGVDPDFKKLPTIKALNTEYAELLAEKKAAYADYRKAREEMKELLTAKANIDRILELDKEHEEANERREKEAEQR